MSFFENYFTKSTIKNIATLSMVKWYNKVEEARFDTFNVIVATFYEHYDNVLNFWLRNSLQKLVISLFSCCFISGNQELIKQLSDDDQRQSYRNFLYYWWVRQVFECWTDKNLYLSSHNSNGKHRRNRKERLSESEIMTMLVCYHFDTYCNLKEYYQNCISDWYKHKFPVDVSYSCFVEIMSRCIL